MIRQGTLNTVLVDGFSRKGTLADCGIERRKNVVASWGMRSVSRVEMPRAFFFKSGSPH
jgi:hypothetical protein